MLLYINIFWGVVWAVRVSAMTRIFIGLFTLHILMKQKRSISSNPDPRFCRIACRQVPMQTYLFCGRIILNCIVIMLLQYDHRLSPIFCFRVRVCVRGCAWIESRVWVVPQPLVIPPYNTVYGADQRNARGPERHAVGNDCISARCARCY